MKSLGKNRRFLWALVGVCIAAAGVAIGVSLSWFMAGKQLSSVARIQYPAELRILNPDESQMTKIDLSYTDDDITDENGTKKVTVTKPFMITSGSKDFDLYLAHTTNIKGMKIKLYRAAETDSASSLIQYPGAGGVVVHWDKKAGENNLFTNDAYTKENGKGYLNLTRDTENENIKDPDDKIADKSKNNKIFTTEGDTPQTNASPLYWKFEESADATKANVTKDSDDLYRFRYILQISWTEKEKETDIVYIIAQPQKGASNAADDAQTAG